MRKIHIYTIGVMLFGLVYYPLKDALSSGPLLLLFAVIYAVLVRLIAERLGKPEMTKVDPNNE